MLLPDQLTSDSSTTDILTIASGMDSNTFNFFETESSIVVQPDLKPLTGNMNSVVCTGNFLAQFDWTMFYDSRETTGSIT